MKKKKKKWTAVRKVAMKKNAIGRCDPDCGIIVVDFVYNCKDVTSVLKNSCDEDGSLVWSMILVVPRADDCVGWLGQTVLVRPLCG